MDTWSDGIIFASTFAVCAIAGFAALLRSGGLITVRSVLSHGLNSGLSGTAICLVFYDTYKEKIYFLVGTSIMLGLLGLKGVDWITGYFKKNVLKLHVDKEGNIKFGDPENK